MNKSNLQSLYKWLYSCTVATLFMFIIYFTMNLPFPVPMSIERQKLEWFEKLSFSRSQENPDYRDSILYIDVCYDQTMEMEYNQEGIGKGFVPVADHEKIYRLLKIFQEREYKYRYIILDILFESNIRKQPIDSALFKLICQMPNIVIPIPTESNLSDSCLVPKACYGEYFHGKEGFTRYPYYTSAENSIPLKIYQDLTGRTIERRGPLFWDDGDLVRNSVFLAFDFTDYSLDTLKSSPLHNHVYIGKFLGDSVNNIPMRPRVLNESLISGKYILIGNSQTDVHSTYLGSLSGPIINFNAYLSLLRGRHHVSWIFLALMILGMSVLCYYVVFGPGYTSHMSNHCINQFLNNIVTTKGITYLFTFICLLMYWINNTIYDIFIIVFLFFSLNFFKSICHIDTSKYFQFIYIVLLFFLAFVISMTSVEIIAKYFFYIVLIIPIVNIIIFFVKLFVAKTK